MFPDLFRDDVFRIETRRLWLRWPTARDAEAIQRLAGDSAVAEMTARIPWPLDRAAVDTFLVGSRAANAAGTGLTLTLCERSRPARAIGVIAIDRPTGEAQAELGYWLGRPFWGAGLISEATEALVHAWFAWTEAGCLDASARVTNPVSRRVLEKTGFAWMGRAMADYPARGGACEVDRFRMDRARWLSRTERDDYALMAAE